MKTFSIADVGRFGEKVTVKYLKRHGFKILEKNCRIRRLEMDIVAADKTHIVFVEVKTRRTDMNNIMRPSAAVDFEKRENLISFSKAYTKRLSKRNSLKQIRIDVSEVYVRQERKKLRTEEFNYIENAVSR